MIRHEFGPDKQYCVRWDGYETKVDVQGSLTVAELAELLDTLKRAHADRIDAPHQELP